jgi:hypothetical protein
MVLRELNPPQYLKQYVKSKVRSLVRSQVRYGILQILNTNPRVYGFPGESVERIMRRCICGRLFIPKQEAHKYCSEECRRKRKKGMVARRRYELWEEEIIWETLSRNGCKAEILQELARRLGRKPEAIRSKYKKLRKKRRAVA